jgi:hypothetical protein
LPSALRGCRRAFETHRVLLLLTLFIELVALADVGITIPLLALNPIKVCPHLLDCKQAPDMRDKPRKLSRERRM